jgi:sensor histidine kinase YesM
MSNIKTYLPKKWRSLLSLNFVIAAILTLLFNTKAIKNFDVAGFLPDFLYSYLISLTLSSGITIIIETTDKRLSWINAPVKRFFTEITSVTLYAFTIGVIFQSVDLLILSDKFTFSNLPWDYVLYSTRYPIIISLIVTAILTSRAFLLEWRRVAIASEKLRADNYQGQYQSLKNQLNPHFLFNSFNTLSSLVYDDQEKAVEFIQKLSKIYRYVLEVQKEELITIAEELRFVQNYLDLQKIRFGSNLKIHLDEIQSDRYIPPLSLQLLLENAIKHNIISTEYPLTIAITENNNYLIVKNTLQLKDIGEASTGIGISNINERLSFFTDERLIIEKTKDSFVVRLPLIKNIDS